jgi:nickel-dependent lactate racemase
MKRVTLEYGDGFMDIEVPDHAVVVAAGDLYQDQQPSADPVTLTRQALAHPLGTGRIRDLVGAGARGVVAFPDRVKGGFHETAHRRVALPLILEELREAGVGESDITLVCAIGLHRKNRRDELEAYLGREIVDRFWGRRLVNHDAEDPDGMIHIGETDEGDVVDMNRAAGEADLTILLGHAMGNPYGGYSGGYKMPCTGLAGWRSIRCHHTPRSLFNPDFVPISPESHFRHQLHKIGRAMEAGMKRPFFAVDAVLNGQSRQLAVHAGLIPEVEQATWPAARRRTEVTVPGEPADVLVVGMPRTFHYGPGMGSNPILMKQAIGASLARAFGALKPSPVVIVASVCDGWFNDEWFPAYRPIYERLMHCNTVDDLVRYEDEISTDPELVRLYRHGYAYHPFHGFSMAYMGALADRYARAIYVVGAKEPGYARSMGCITLPTFDQALRQAERYVGRDPRLLIVPRLTTVQVHVHHAGRAAA